MVSVEMVAKVLVFCKSSVAFLAGESFLALMGGLGVPGEMALSGKGLATIPANKFLSPFVDGCDMLTKDRRL